MVDHNLYIDHLLECLDESERNKTSIQNAEINKHISHFNAEHEPRKIKMAAINRVESFDDLMIIGEGFQRILENDPVARRILIKHQEGHSKHLRNAQKGTLFVVDQHFPDGRLKKGANHKRASSDEDLNNFKDFQPPSLRERDTFAEHAQHDRAFVEKYGDEIYGRSAHLLSAAHNAEPEVGHEASAMSGKSPGRGRPRKQHSANKAPNPPDNRTDEPSSPSSTLAEKEQEVADSQESYEKEGVVETSRRVKPNTREKVKLHKAEVDVVNSAKDEPQYAHTHDNARDSRDSQENKDALKTRKPWSALERYLSEANSRPDYGPIPSDPAPAEPVAPRKMPMPAGFQPHNRLRASNNPPYRNPIPQKPADKPFDLEKGEYHPPNKKQKTGPGSAAHATQIHKEVIDVEAGPSHRTISSRSLHSHTQNALSMSNGSRGGNSVKEYQNVESLMQPPIKNRRKVAGASNGQGPKTVSVHQFLKPAAREATIIRHSEVVDDISDDDVEMVGSGIAGRTTPQVVIPSYKDTGNLKPAREKPNGTTRNTSITTSKNTGTASPFFSQEGRRGSVESISEVAPIMPQNKPTSRQQNGNLSKVNGAAPLSKRSRNSDLDLDELSHEVPASPDGNRGGGTRLLGKRKQANGSLAAARTESPCNVDSDDSDLERKKADMVTTSLSKRSKRAKVPGETRFDVIQVFSERTPWLFPEHSKSWHIFQNCEAGILTIFNDGGDAVEDLELVPASINQIHRNEKNGKILIIKAADRTARGAVKICLELSDPYQSEDFTNNMKRFSATISTALVSFTKLDSIFNNFRTNIETAIKKEKAKPIQEQDNPHFLPQKSQAIVSEQFNRVQAARQPVRSQGMKDRMGKEEDDPHSLNLSRSRRTRSSSEVIDDDTGEAPRRAKMRKLEPVPPSSFYSSTAKTGNPHETRSSSRIFDRELASRSLPKPRTPSPERWTELNPDWEKAWRNSIIYPKEGKNKATVDKQDIRRLDEGEYLNDNLIMFYLLRLERTLAERSPELAKRIYFHNTFFYERLSKPVKGKKGINYEAVERWTAKVDLFSYDYIIVPVNEHKHWYVAIICNVRKLVNPDLEVIEDSQSQQVSPDARKSQLDVDTRTKSSHTLSPKHHSTRPSATGVDKSLEQMSLTEDADVEEWPSVEPYPGASEETSPRGRSNRQVVEESPRPESTTIDLEETSKPAVTAKKGKRKSTPAPRKYNPKDPRIITLDSLGINHPTTCTNLRDYLIAEMKSKLDKDIPIPRPLGMTAVKIPQQKNYCDCGVFLLSYIEQFLKCPDQFTEDLLQKVDIEVDYDLTPAPKMRTRIRKLLLGLQAEQMIEEKEKAEAKGKAKKKASKAEGKDEAAPSTKSNSREASKSARASIDAESPMSNRASAQPELAEREALQESASRSPQPGGARKESPPERPAESGRHERDTDGLTPESQAGPYFPRTSERASEEDIDLENDTQNVPAMGNASTAASGIGSIFSSISKPFSRLLSDAASSNQTRPGRSRSDAMEISDDSPQKAKHDSPPTFDPDSPSAQLRKEDYQKLISPSPELDENLSDHRGRLPIPYPQQEHDGASPDLDETQDTKGIDKMAVGNDTEITDSSPLQPALKLTSDINDNPNDEEARKEEAIEDNDVMLLDQETVHAPPFLVDPPSTPLTSPRRRKIATSPQRESSRKPNPRKGSKSSEPTNVRRPSGSMAVRDHSDFALIGRHMGKVTKFEGKRTKFSSSP